MKDGQVIGYKIADDLNSISFECRGGLSRTFDLRLVHEQNLKRAAAVGFAQVRIVDAAAVPRADADGNLIPEAERTQRKWQNMMRLVEHYESGTDQWNLRQAAAPRQTNLADIRVALAKFGVEDAKIAGMDDEKLKHLAKSKAIALILLEMAQERVSGLADADELLEELMG